jgi:hypothetical protein
MVRAAEPPRRTAAYTAARAQPTCRVRGACDPGCFDASLRGLAPVPSTMADHDTGFLSLATAGVAGALFMYWVDASRRSRSVAASGRRTDSTHLQERNAPHPTRPAKAAWNEQGV